MDLKEIKFPFSAYFPFLILSPSVLVPCQSPLSRQLSQSTVSLLSDPDRLIVFSLFHLSLSHLTLFSDAIFLGFFPVFFSLHDIFGK